MTLEEELRAFCESFIMEHTIRAPESCYQVDSTVTAAPELVEGICDILGYYNDDTNSLDRSKFGDPRTPEFGVGR